ncbi:MAG: hypothetical protein A2538_00655 [Candidatus Magasanikbacteria bacterium RIFOXYD2_FULL_41_14]|uniref:Uncharacterized protein n=1 Tax=Candidatus Magasanikbacteria bacterium RIFOXYD2_FULL_41_14 TaxID=1798709 RepID=A0A1F6PBP1_9BACT|nr:MAG: hypothetical protein A2538_00655 [Candidatus Magasanikbacteria bacterium RIFOXYD2_FULL_41_14]
MIAERGDGSMEGQRDFRGQNTRSMPGFNREVERCADEQVNNLCTLEDLGAYLRSGDTVAKPQDGQLADLVLSSSCSDILRTLIFSEFPSVRGVVLERESDRIADDLRNRLSQ